MQGTIEAFSLGPSKMLVTSLHIVAAFLASSGALAAPGGVKSRRQSTNSTLLTDINTIQEYWGQISPYRDNDERYFGVNDVGLPDGCVEGWL